MFEVLNGFLSSPKWTKIDNTTWTNGTTVKDGSQLRVNPDTKFKRDSAEGMLDGGDGIAPSTMY